jgi:hypothetical protein
VNLKVMIGASIFTFLLIFFQSCRFVNLAEEAQRPRVVMSFLEQKMMDLLKFNFCYLIFLARLEDF